VVLLPTVVPRFGAVRCRAVVCGQERAPRSSRPGLRVGTSAKTRRRSIRELGRRRVAGRLAEGAHRPFSASARLQSGAPDPRRPAARPRPLTRQPAPPPASLGHLPPTAQSPASAPCRAACLPAPPAASPARQPGPGRPLSGRKEGLAIGEGQAKPTNKPRSVRNEIKLSENKSLWPPR
jgi:hypothetical protein